MIMSLMIHAMMLRARAPRHTFGHIMAHASNGSPISDGDESFIASEPSDGLSSGRFSLPGVELTEEEAREQGAKIRRDLEDDDDILVGGAKSASQMKDRANWEANQRRSSIEEDDGYDLVGEGYGEDRTRQSSEYAYEAADDTEQSDSGVRWTLSSRSPYETLWQRKFEALKTGEAKLKRQAARFIEEIKKEYEVFWADSQPWLYESRLVHSSPFGIAEVEPPSFSEATNVLGPVLLQDCSVMWHNVLQPSPSTVCLYWTIEFSVAILPWRPRCETGAMTNRTL